jgi:hypothetical protein
MRSNKNKAKLYRKNNNTCHNNSISWDYTPLFKFLLGKVGCKWNDVYKEARSRLNTCVPIYWMVSRNFYKTDVASYIRVGESTYYSSLYVDSEGLLQVINNTINHTNFKPLCSCCTYTFNGKLVVNKYVSNKI